MFLLVLYVGGSFLFVTSLQLDGGRSYIDMSRVTQCPEMHTHTRYISAHYTGRLGNWIWMYASLYGLARKTERTAFTCTSRKVWDIGELFPGTSIPLYDSALCREVRVPHDTIRTRDAVPRSYQQDFILIAKQSNKSHVIMNGYRQNLNYFIEYLDELKTKELVLDESLQAYAQRYLHELAEKVSESRNGSLWIDDTGVAHLDGKPYVFVNVHVRGADHLYYSPNNPSDVFYTQAMDYIRNKYGMNVVFNIITDDPTWARFIIKAEDVYFTHNTHRSHDFAIGHACNQTILGLSTFAWWMAFLGRSEEVVYYQHSDYEGQHKPGGYWSHEWTPIQVEAYANQTFMEQYKEFKDST